MGDVTEIGENPRMSASNSEPFYPYTVDCR